MHRSQARSQRVTCDFALNQRLIWNSFLLLFFFLLLLFFVFVFVFSLLSGAVTPTSFSHPSSCQLCRFSFHAKWKIAWRTGLAYRLHAHKIFISKANANVWFGWMCAFICAKCEKVNANMRSIKGERKRCKLATGGLNTLGEKLAIAIATIIAAAASSSSSGEQ